MVRTTFVFPRQYAGTVDIKRENGQRVVTASDNISGVKPEDVPVLLGTVLGLCFEPNFPNDMEALVVIRKTELGPGRLSQTQTEILDRMKSVLSN